LRPAGATPVLQKHTVAPRGVGTRIDQEITRIDCVACAEFERLRVAAHHPERRMRPLQRRHRKLGGISVKGFAVEREWLFVAERCAQIADEFQRRRFSLRIIETERTEIIRINARHEAKLQPAAEHLIDGDFFGKAERMIERHDIAHRADAQSFGACACADCVEARRGHPALVRPEMMFDAKGVVEADLIAQRELAPKLLVALMRRHAGLGPDMRKMRELHGVETLPAVLAL
jgi:hypothetical protein